MLSHVEVCKGTLWCVGVFCVILGLFCFGIHTCLYIFEYVGCPLVCLSIFACNWVCYSKFFDVFVGFHMLCSLLNILAHHLSVHFSKSTLFWPPYLSSIWLWFWPSWFLPFDLKLWLPCWLTFGTHFCFYFCPFLGSHFGWHVVK